VRIATYNVEWFNALFDDAGRVQADDRWSARHGVTRAEQAEALARVFRAMDADAVMVIEAPDRNGRRDTIRALEHFAKWAGLRTGKAVMGFKNETEQEIALLYDPAAIAPRHDPQSAPEAPRFDDKFRIDLDIDATPDVVTFSKPPLELACTASGRSVRMIGVHIKSKAPHGARTPEEAARLSIANRRKQLAQCIWLRHRVETHLTAGDSLIVLGDFNDGPGLDEYEKLFGRSGVEIVMGTDGSDTAPLLYDPHARRAISQRVAAAPTTARFFIAPENRWLAALLDFVMVSPDLLGCDPRWRIWHPFDDPECYRDTALRHALLHASDHFPVTLDLAL
jgi:endonuclease/exonuclease/phosphatase family metal-dependent hydrolase